MEKENSDIDKFIYINRYKNGKVTITNTLSRECNIYKLLAELGYGFVRTNGRRIYFHESPSEFKVVRILEIKHAFLKFLETTDFKNIPDDITLTDILNWFYQKNPVKINGLFEHYLERKLTESEINKLTN